MIKAHLPNVLTYFTHRITSATNEAINGVIKSNRSGEGLRGRDRLCELVAYDEDHES